MPVARPATGACQTEPAVADSPLSAADMHAYEDSRLRLKKINRAAGVARFNGWTSGIFAVFSLLGGLFSLTSFLLGVALAIVSYNEFKGGKRLQLLDRDAARTLGHNQIGFLCHADNLRRMVSLQHDDRTPIHTRTRWPPPVDKPPHCSDRLAIYTARSTWRSTVR